MPRAVTVNQLREAFEIGFRVHLPSPIEITLGDAPLFLSTDTCSRSEDLVICSLCGTIPTASELNVYRLVLDANWMWTAAEFDALAVRSNTRELMLFYRHDMTRSRPSNLPLANCARVAWIGSKGGTMAACADIAIATKGTSRQRGIKDFGNQPPGRVAHCCLTS